MKRMKCTEVVFAAVLFFSFPCLFSSPLGASEDVPRLPRFFLNGKPALVTVQDLSGLGTRPLRLLLQKNNKAHGDELIQVYALGAR